MLCQNLNVLNYGDMFLTRKCYTPVYVRSRSSLSSTLTKLKINVGTFVDCLILLDGRLPRLSTLIVNVITVFKPIIDITQGVSVDSTILFKKKHHQFHYVIIFYSPIFLGKNSQYEMFYIHFIVHHSRV